MAICFYLLLLLHSLTFSWSFTASLSLETRRKTRRHASCWQQLSAVKIEGYDEAFEIIDDCARTGESNEKLYGAVRFIEVNGYKIFPDLTHKQQLWETAQGSWKLQLSTGSAKNRSFHPPPAFLPFSFAMIDKHHFGNGVGKNQDTIWLALLHNHYWNARFRRMVVTPVDIYLFGRKLPDFFERALPLGKKPDEFEGRPPTFVLVGASQDALIARGNQSGGLAIWSRLPNDIRKVAYKDYTP